MKLRVGVADPSRETSVASAGVGQASTETGITFAGKKQVLLVRFAVAMVLSVSMVVVQGYAVAVGVSRWFVSTITVVSSPLRRYVRCAGKSALRARNASNLMSLKLLGELCHRLSGGEDVPGECCRVCRPRHHSLWYPRHPPHRSRRELCSIGNWLSTYQRRAGVLVALFSHVVVVRSRFDARM